MAKKADELININRAWHKVRKEKQTQNTDVYATTNINNQIMAY